MKRILFIFLISLIIINVNAKNNNLDLYNKTIYLDIGHGGKDPGSISNNIRESDLNLSIGKEVKKELNKEGAKVYLTRYDDYDLSLDNEKYRKRSDLARRAYIINNSDANLYISIHLNSDPNKKYFGPQIYYDSINPNNKKIAEIFTNTFKENFSFVREYKNNDTLYMERRIKKPGILLEAGFISNDKERNKLLNKTYQNKIAKTITKSIINYQNFTKIS